MGRINAEGESQSNSSQIQQNGKVNQNGNQNVGFEEHSNRQISFLPFHYELQHHHHFILLQLSIPILLKLEEDSALQLHSQSVAPHQSRWRGEEDIRIQRDILWRRIRERSWREGQGEGANWSYSDPSIVLVSST